MERISIIPKPVSIKYGEGEFRSLGIPFIKGDGGFHSEIETAKEQLKGDFNLPGTEIVFDEERSVFCTDGLKSDNDESYFINISANQITIEAASPKGMYHGLQTIRQLVISEYKDGRLCLPCAEITDHPRFSWRGLMLDSSRYFYSVAFIKRLLDVLSLHHINRFHWHLTDDQGWRLPVPEFPLLTEIGSYRDDKRKRWMPKQGGFYTECEIRDIVDYAAKRHIEIIPEVDLPGHASAILASYPGLGCTGGPYQVEDRFGIFEDVLCAGNNQIFDLAASVFDTLVKLFPSKWVHIGGDEVLFERWENCTKCKNRLEELGIKKASELQSWITQILVQMLGRRERVAIGWDEILGLEDNSNDDTDCKKFPLPKDAVVMSWRGDAGGIKASSMGHNVIMTPNTKGCYLDYKHFDVPEEPGQLYAGAASVYSSYSLEPVTPEMSGEDAQHILGGQGNMWSELIYAGKFAEYMIFPRICAIAEAVWTPKEGKDFEDFTRRMKVHQKRLDDLGIYQFRGELK